MLPARLFVFRVWNEIDQRKLAQTVRHRVEERCQGIQNYCRNSQCQVYQAIRPNRREETHAVRTILGLTAYLTISLRERATNRPDDERCDCNLFIIGELWQFRRGKSYLTAIFTIYLASGSFSDSQAILDDSPMPTDHRELAFEDAIEHHLLTDAGYERGDPANFDRERAVDPTVLVSFIRETQPAKWESLQKIHGVETEDVVLDDLCKAMDSQGSLNVIRHGFKSFGKDFRVAFFAPAHGMNPDTQKLYAANRLTVTRQLHYSTANENSLDLVLSINGIPVATAELKNKMTGQNVEHAKHQYKTDRDQREKIFEFKKRTLVHFAVDPDLVYMTTRLSGSSTFFLPFNLGDGTGAGNPPNPGGYRTAYLWEQVWARDSLMDLLGRFLHLEVKTRKFGGKTVKKETMIFPRFHQLDLVRKLEADARSAGAGRNYLIQHSAGSGKSNEIAWLAHRLASLHDEHDEKVFHSVVVITDRVVLDKQLQDTIYQFEHKQGVVEKIDQDSSQLAAALKGGTPIVITTLQKFPFVTKKVGDLPDRAYAVIVDEAHSSQSGETATELKAVLAGSQIKNQVKQRMEEEGLLDHEEEILRTMARRGKRPNLSFFAFTATPKFKTLEVFGRPGADGKPAPFHLYSMRQAIEEGFILDVLEHYTTYKAYYGLIKSIEDDPQVERKKAAKALARFMSLHPHNIAQKTEVMVEHFRASTRHKIGGKAKAMVVTSSRLHAVQYKKAFDKYFAEQRKTLRSSFAGFWQPTATCIRFSRRSFPIKTRIWRSSTPTPAFC